MEARDADGTAPSSVSDLGRMEQGLLGSGLLGRLSIFSMSQTGWDCGKDQSLVNTESPLPRNFCNDASYGSNRLYFPLTEASMHFSPLPLNNITLHCP